jgi:hypothetical protein
MFVGNEGLKKNIYKAVRTGMGIKEAAGVGIVTKQNTTPDVNKKTLGKIMKALHLK